MSEPLEFSRPYDSAEALKEGGQTLTLEASAEERAALARRLGLRAMGSLQAELALAPWRGAGLKVSGRVRAKITQSCVVTLEPMETMLDEPIEVAFLPAGMLPDPVEEEAIGDAEAPDPPEALPEGGVIELGEIAVQHLAVAIDPYPRKPGAAFIQPGGAEGAPEANRPFAKLAALKPGGKT